MTRRGAADVCIVAWLCVTLAVVAAAYFGVLP